MVLTASEYAALGRLPDERTTDLISRSISSAEIVDDGTGRQSGWWSSSGCFIPLMRPSVTVIVRVFPNFLHDSQTYYLSSFLKNLYV